MSTKKVTAKDKSAKAFEDMPKLSENKAIDSLIADREVHVEYIKKLESEREQTIKNIEDLKDQLGNQEALVDHLKTREITNIKTMKEWNKQIIFLTKLNNDLKSILKQTVDKLV